MGSNLAFAQSSRVTAFAMVLIERNIGGALEKLC